MHHGTIDASMRQLVWSGARMHHSTRDVASAYRAASNFNANENDGVHVHHSTQDMNPSALLAAANHKETVVASNNLNGIPINVGILQNAVN